MGYNWGMASRPVFVVSEEPPFYREEIVEFRWLKGRSFKAAKTNSENLRNAALEKGISIYEISRVGERYSKLSAFKLLVKAKSDLILPLEIVYQYAKLWEGELESTPFDTLPLSARGVKGSRASKKEARERGKGKQLKGFQINFGYGEKIDFPHKPEDAFYNWLYITTLRQRHNQKIHEDLLLLLRSDDHMAIGFSDIFFVPMGKKVIRYNCQAKAVAQYLSIYRFYREKIEDIFPITNSLYEVRAQLRSLFSRFVQLAYPSYSESSSPGVPVSCGDTEHHVNPNPNEIISSKTGDVQLTLFL